MKPINKLGIIVKPIKQIRFNLVKPIKKLSKELFKMFLMSPKFWVKLNEITKSLLLRLNCVPAYFFNGILEIKVT